jgi:LPS-assembly lipoprotein
MLAASLGLGGCGFHPLYAPRGPQDWDPDLAAISVAPIRDRSGQILALALREYLNPGGAPVPARWLLATSLTISRVDLGIQRNATAISSEVTVSVSYVVSDIKTGQAVYTSTSRASGDFDRLNDAYATQVAGDDAQERALHQVAEEIALRMALFVRQQRAKRASP